MRSVKFLYLSLTADLVARTGRLIGKPWLAGNGRHTDLWPFRCEDCGFVARVKKAVHGYQDDGTGEDVVGVDECPRCGSESLDTPYCIFSI